MNQQMTKILQSNIEKNKNENICIVTGEASGDAQAALLLNELSSHLNSYVFWGIGGFQLHKAGMELLFPIEKLAFLGIVEIAKHYFTIAAILKKLLFEIEIRKPKIIIVVDYSSFNLRLAEEATLRGFKVIYYIPPKVWAHGLYRIEKLKKYTSLIVSILPFEVDFFQKYGLNAIFVGNPLRDHVDHFLSEKTKSNNNENAKKFLNNDDATMNPRLYPYIIGLLPGSRKPEIERMLPLMIESFVKLKQEFPNITAKVPVAQTIQLSFIQNIFLNTCKKLHIDDKILIEKIEFFTGKTYDVMYDAHYAWVCSGTAALETAFFKTPLSTIYKVNPITAFIAKQLLKIKYASLANLCMNAEVIPEFLQKSANVDNLVSHARLMLTDIKKREEMLEKFETLNKLFPNNAAYHAAIAIVSQFT